jgi:hypothetical protein
MTKTLATIFALSLCTTVASAQQGTPPPPPAGPTAVECQQGWKEDSRWTKAQFEAACLKIKEGQKN